MDRQIDIIPLRRLDLGFLILTFGTCSASRPCVFDKDVVSYHFSVNNVGKLMTRFVLSKFRMENLLKFDPFLLPTSSIYLYIECVKAIVDLGHTPSYWTFIQGKKPVFPSRPLFLHAWLFVLFFCLKMMRSSEGALASKPVVKA